MKRPPTLSVDEARILPRYRPPEELVARAQLTRAQGRALASVATPGVARTPAGGDPRDLRGIPVQGVRGTSGTVRGTAPELAAMRADGRKGEPSRPVPANPSRAHPHLRVTEPMVAFA